MLQVCDEFEAQTMETHAAKMKEKKMFEDTRAKHSRQNEVFSA